ncbi:MAG: response regulator, partial [Pseudomonadota bacterium]
MNEQTPKISGSKPEHLRAFLDQVPGRVTAILENWQQLVRSDWDAGLLTALLERIHTLAEAGEKFDVPRIRQNGKSLQSNLSEYTETGYKPPHDDIVVLDGLVHAFRDAVMQACKRVTPGNISQESDAPSPKTDGGQKILLLGLDEASTPGLLQGLRACQFQVESLPDVESLFAYQSRQQDSHTALISHIKWLTRLYPESKQEGLWHKAGGRPGLPVAFIADSNDLQTRLSAMRTEAKAFWTLPIEPLVVANRMEELTAPSNQAAYRVLIVEDDPAQADFASAILGKADFECRSVIDPLRVMGALFDFRPDLILMDLYMPGASGTELTRIIREQVEFVDTPIVFLSGEQDVDKQLHALSFGGEDFLAKPIGPKHLISTVTNRIQRAQQLTQRPGRYSGSDDGGDLLSRHYLMRRLDSLLLSTPKENEQAAVFYLDVDNADEVIKKVGIGGMDVVLAEVARDLRRLLQPRDLLSRFGDNSLGLLASRASIAELKSFGQTLCGQIAAQIIEVENHTLGAHLSIGIYPITQGDQDASTLFSLARLASRVAQNSGGNQVYLQPLEARPTTPTEADESLKKLILIALEKGYLEIYFQPMVALKGTTHAHYQTLIRLQEPEGKLYTAGMFIPAAERLGVIGRIDQWTAQTALCVINGHKRQGNKLHLFVSQAVEFLENTERLSWLQEQHRTGLLSRDE